VFVLGAFVLGAFVLGGRLQNAPTERTLKVIDYKSVCNTYPAIAGFPTQHTLKVIGYQDNQLCQRS